MSRRSSFGVAQSPELLMAGRNLSYQGAAASQLTNKPLSGARGRRRQGPGTGVPRMRCAGYFHGRKPPLKAAGPPGHQVDWLGERSRGSGRV